MQGCRAASCLSVEVLLRMTSEVANIGMLNMGTRVVLPGFGAYGAIVTARLPGALEPLAVLAVLLLSRC